MLLCEVDCCGRGLQADEERRRREKEEEAMASLAICGVCFEGVSSDLNQIVFCDGRRRDGRICGVAVHQNCYDISAADISSETDLW